MVNCNVSSQPHPVRHGIGGTAWTLDSKFRLSMGISVTAASTEMSRENTADEGPSPDTMNEIDSLGGAESGQQYPSIGRTVDFPSHSVPLLG